MSVSDSKASAYNAGDLGWIPGSGRSFGEGTHSSTLAYKIPLTEEHGRLQSMGLQRVRHNRATKHSTAHVYTHIYIPNLLYSSLDAHLLPYVLETVNNFQVL